jgi:DUF4097 and DUF4098 domain-containing protein YvlB
MAEPVRLNISTRSGSVRVIAEAGTDLRVDGGSVVGAHDGALEIRRDRHASEIVVYCPVGSDVTVGTVSGPVEMEGPLDAVRIATVSGKVRVAQAERVDVRAKSGSIVIGTCNDECRVVVTSAKIHIGHARRAAIAGVSGVVLAENVDGAQVKTVSGKVLLGTTGAGNVDVHTVSGRVEITVPSDVQPNTRLRSLSGRVVCDCARGDDGEIAVASVSGAIKVSPES